MITVISVCFQRFRNYEKILQAWLGVPEVDEVIVLDNSGSFKTDLPVLVVSVSENLGPQAKYSLALWAKNDKIIFADDDILVEPGIARDFLEHWTPHRAVGMIGRVFRGGGYYDSKGFRGKSIDKPVPVGWLGGGCTLVGREHCRVLMRGCPDMTVDDMWWEHCNPKMDLYVVPTQNYRFMEEDAHALHRTKRIKELRERYYKEWLV